MKHYSKADLELYRHGKTSVLGRIACKAHLKNCPECAELLRELESEDAFVRDLRNSVRIFSALHEKAPNASAHSRSTV